MEFERVKFQNIEFKMNNTLHNGLKILEFLATNAEAISIKEIAEHFQLPNSHVCRLLKSLTELGYAEQIPGSRKYRISLKILNLANARLKKENLLECGASLSSSTCAKIGYSSFCHPGLLRLFPDYRCGISGIFY